MPETTTPMAGNQLVSDRHTMATTIFNLCICLQQIQPQPYQQFFRPGGACRRISLVARFSWIDPAECPLQITVLEEGQIITVFSKVTRSLRIPGQLTWWMSGCPLGGSVPSQSFMFPRKRSIKRVVALTRKGILILTPCCQLCIGGPNWIKIPLFSTTVSLFAPWYVRRFLKIPYNTKYWWSKYSCRFYLLYVGIYKDGINIF